MRFLPWFILAACSFAAHGGESAETAVTSLDAQLNNLIKTHAVGQADSYYAPDFVLTTSSGARKTKADMIREIGTAGVVINVNETRDVQVRVRGDTAVLTAILRQQGSLNGTDFDVELWVTDTWVRGGEHGWRLFAGQATRIPKKA